MQLPQPNTITDDDDVHPCGLVAVTVYTPGKVTLITGVFWPVDQR
jgi:hypothetical protein